MPTKHIENLTTAPIFVGGKLIPPGSGRDIDVALLPPEHRDPAAPAAAPAEPGLAELVQALQAKAVKEIVAELPGLKQVALDLLAEAERAHAKPRTSLMTAIEAERLRRADERFQAEADAAYQQQLAGLTPEQRAALGEQPAA